MTPAYIPILSRLSERTAATEAWLCDIWGVMHNGRAAFADAIAACHQFRAAGGVVILISNAPRPHHVVATQLVALGIDNTCYDAILSSGDVTRDLLRARAGTPTHHIGPERDHGIFEGLGLRLVGADKAELLLCSGLFDDTAETPDTYRTTFEGQAARGVPMICANPDVHVERNGQIIWCAGGLAALYETMGGRVTYAGKPHAAVYDTAFAMIDRIAKRPIPRPHILAIGDGVNTDIKGAASVGIPSIYVQSAIHLSGALTPAALAALFDPLALRPDAAMVSLVW